MQSLREHHLSSSAISTIKRIIIWNAILISEINARSTIHGIDWTYRCSLVCRVVTHLKNNDSDSADTTCIVLYCSFIIFHIQSPYYVYICLETSVQQEDCRPPFSDATTGFGFALSFTFTFTMNPLPWFLFLVVGCWLLLLAQLSTHNSQLTQNQSCDCHVKDFSW